jgi:threonine dehydratase
MLDPTFQNAREFLSKYLSQTRLVLGGSLSGSSDQNVYLKLENELPTGSFKVRGALYALGLQMQDET